MTDILFATEIGYRQTDPDEIEYRMTQMNDSLKLNNIYEKEIKQH